MIEYGKSSLDFVQTMILSAEQNCNRSYLELIVGHLSGAQLPP